MKSFRSTFFALGLLLVVSTAHAQSSPVSARIPFDFVVGKQVLPAGDYTLSHIGAGSQELAIRNTEQGTTKLTNSRACEQREPAKKTVLVFNRFGDQYFLSEIWVEGNSRGRQLPKSPIETQMAMDHHGGEAVIVAGLKVR
jgi:hypothetical protein